MDPKMRRWMITINNPQEHYPINEETIPRHVKYMVYQLEIGELGTPHIQMYVELRSTQRLSWFTKWLGTAIHAEIARSGRDTCREYCMKEDTRVEGPFEYGCWGKEPKANLQNSMQQALDGVCLDTIAMEDPHSYTRARGPLKKMRSIHFKKKFCIRYKELELRPWQENVIQILNGEPDDRMVIWVCGQRGGEGKTSFGKYLVSNRDAFMFNGGRNEDVIYAYDYHRIVIFDFARCQEIRYDLIEHFKDGILFNSKYESHVMYCEPVHLIVLTNNMPDYQKISADRIVMFEL